MNVIGVIFFICFLLLMFFVQDKEDKRNEEAGIKSYTTNGIATMPDSWFKWFFLATALFLLYVLLSQA